MEKELGSLLTSLVTNHLATILSGLGLMAIVALLTAVVTTVRDAVRSSRG